MGKQPRQPKLTLVVPDDLRRKARAKAITQGTSLSAVVREFLKKWIEDDPSTEEENDQED